MKRFLVLLVTVPALAFACSDSETTTNPDGDRVSTILALTGDTAAGQTSFEGSCGLGSTCHNADGTSNGQASDLTETTSTLTDGQIVTTILEGEGSMPAQDTLADQTIANIVTFMRAEWGN